MDRTPPVARVTARAAALVALCTLVGCAIRAQGRVPDGGLPPQRADTTVEGTVSVVGADPFTQVVLATSAGDVAVLGSLKGEVASLQGGLVTVWGLAVANRPPAPARAVGVRGYDVVSVGGEPVHVGELVRRGEDLWLLGRDSVRLASVPPVLTGRVGAKVWVGGVFQGETLLVRMFGMIREAPAR